MYHQVNNYLRSFPDVWRSHWPTVVVGGVLCFGSGHCLFNWYKCRQMKSKMQVRASKSKENIQRLKDELLQLKINEEIVNLSFQELQSRLQNGDIKALEVLRSFQAKALTVNDKVNAITDIIPSAMAQASHLDKLSSTERGTLHGIPISVKESIGLKGEDCTAGFGELIGQLKAEDAILVTVLKAKGAVPFIRTNLPQGMRSLDCSNPIYGEACNPYDTTRSPGGSSSGEGAIIGGQGSVLGIGSDIAGSVRIPAHYSGICALKPTSSRLSSKGSFGTEALGGQKIIPATSGPMGRDVSSLVHFMRAVVGSELFRLDPSVPQIPFREEIFLSQEPLRIGYYLYDGCTRCVPAVERAVLLGKKALENLGHTLVETQPYKPLYAMIDLLVPAILGDDGDSYTDLLKYDKASETMYKLYKFHQQPYFIRRILASLKELMEYDPIPVGVMKRKPMRSIYDWFKKTVESKIYEKEFTEKWISEKLDIVICPCMPCAATESKVSSKLLGAVTYTSIYNVVDYPAGVLPVTTVTAGDVARTMDPDIYPAKTATEHKLKKDSSTSEGLPIGIQVVGLPFKEELVLRVMAELETAFQTTSAYDEKKLLG